MSMSVSRSQPMTMSPAVPTAYSKGRDIPLAEQRDILDRALAQARGAAPRGIAVFDLDSTLFDNRPRQARILREYGAAHGIAALAAARPEHWQSWSIEAAMRAAGCSEPDIAAHARPAKRFWGERFFTSEYCVDDIAIPGAAAFLDEMRGTGSQIAYVTGRHVVMGPGTIACMKTCGFPVPDDARVHLVLKPTLELGDDAWKIEAYKILDRLGDVACAFDNEPSHVNGYAARYIGALCVHLATDDSGREIPLAPSVPSIANFLR